MKKFNIDFWDCSGAVPVSEEQRDEWISKLINEALEKDKKKPIGPCPGYINFIISGDSLVLVQIYRGQDGKLVLMIEDAQRRRNVLACREGD